MSSDIPLRTLLDQMPGSTAPRESSELLGEDALILQSVSLDVSYQVSAWPVGPAWDTQWNRAARP